MASLFSEQIWGRKNGVFLAAQLSKFLVSNNLESHFAAYIFQIPLNTFHWDRTHPPPPPPTYLSWARICKRLRSPGIYSKVSILPASVTLRAGTRVHPHFRFGSEIWNWSENFISRGSEKKSLISHDSLRCETPKIWSENEGKISKN